MWRRPQCPFVKLMELLFPILGIVGESLYHQRGLSQLLLDLGDALLQGADFQ